MAEPRYIAAPGSYFPADRVRPILEEIIQSIEGADPEKYLGVGSGDTPMSGRDVIAFRSGVTVRWVYAVLSGERDSASLTNVDRVLTAFDRTYLFTLPAEQGGLSDLYVLDDEEVDGGIVGELLDLRPPQSDAFRAASRAHRERLGLREAA